MRRVILALLLIGSVLLASCGPAMMPAVSPQTESGEQFVVALPRIVITFDADGKPGLEGIPIEDIAKSLGYPLDLSAYRIDPFYVNWMTNANIQHIELRQTGDGLALLVNGMLMPSLSFKDGTLERTGDLAILLGPQGEVVRDLIVKLAPVAKRLGVSLVAKFPMQAGAKVIPYASDKIALTAPATPEAPASAVVKFEVKYDADGVPSIMGLSARDLLALGINAPLALHPYYIEYMQLNNIQYLELRSKGDGLFIYLNGTPLPNIVWDKQTLKNAVDVYAQMNPGIPQNYLSLIQQFVPWLGNTDVAVLIHFPIKPGVAPIPVRRSS